MHDGAGTAASRLGERREKDISSGPKGPKMPACQPTARRTSPRAEDKPPRDGNLGLAGDRHPRDGHKKPSLITVGLGPSHATRACERVSLATQRSRGDIAKQRSRGTGPRATVTVSQILHRSGSGEPALQRWVECLPVFACPPRRETYRNGVMKHPQLIKR